MARTVHLWPAHLPVSFAGTDLRGSQTIIDPSRGTVLYVAVQNVSFKTEVFQHPAAFFVPLSFTGWFKGTPLGWIWAHWYPRKSRIFKSPHARQKSPHHDDRCSVRGPDSDLRHPYETDKNSWDDRKVGPQRSFVRWLKRRGGVV